MLAPTDLASQIRPLALSVPGTPQAAHQEVCCGVPSIAPLVQHELLKAVRERMPEAYLRVTRDLGVTVVQTQELIARRNEIISAARVIKLARMIAYETNAREVFAAAGHSLFEELNRDFPGPVKATIRALPRPLRARLALAWTRKIAFGFAGSVNHIAAEHQRQTAALTIFNGVFSDRLDTLGGAHEYYRSIFARMFRELALIDCEVKEIRRHRVFLNQCNYEVVWEV